MGKIHITHCLCHNRHYIAAIAWEEPDFTSESAIEKLKEAVADGIEDGIVEKTCPVCNETEFIYEDGASGYDTMQDAMVYIMQTQEENLRAKQVMEALRN